MAEPTSTTFKQFKADQERLGANDAEIQTQWDALTRSGRPTVVDLVPSSPGPSLADTSADLMGRTKPLIAESAKLTEKRAGRFEAGAAEAETELGSISALARRQELERAAARPAKPDLTKPPSTAARAFLEPGTSVLGQVQTIMQGIGQLAMGIAGTKGRGYAIAATAALKGAAEGWQAGDAERVKRSLAEWQANHEHLMAQYQIERDAFNDLLTDQKQTMSERFAQMRMRAEILQHKDLADALRQENVDRTFNILKAEDDSAIAHGKNTAQIMNWWRVQSNHDQARLDTERRFQAHLKQTERFHNETNARLEGTQAVTQVKPLLSYNQALVDFEKVRQGLRSLDARGLLPKDNTLGQQWLGTIKQRLEPGDPALALVRYLENPLTIGFFDRTLYDERGPRALQVFQKQLTGLEPMPLATAENLINQLEDSMVNKRRAIVGVLEAAINTPVMRETLGVLNRDWDAALGLTPMGSDAGWTIERPQ